MKKSFSSVSLILQKIVSSTMEMKYPDYTRSIVNISASILHHYGLECIHPGLEELDRILETDPRTVIVMLFDGMGSSVLENHLSPHAFLRRHKESDLTSVFPSTTVAATAAIQSGKTPLETGRVGWTQYFKEVDDNVYMFYGTLASTGLPNGAEHLPEKALPYESVWKRIQKAHPEMESALVSNYSYKHFAWNVTRLCSKVRQIAIGKKPKFIYTYWPDPDHLMHQYGVHHPKVRHMMRHINAQVEMLCASLTNAVVIVTADHSQLDTRWIFLEDHPDLQKMILRPTSVETRAASIFVKDEYKDVFREAFEKELGMYFILKSHDEIMDEGLLGNGTPHERINEFIGDYMAIATQSWNLAWDRKEELVKGNHAGLHPEEITVPLIIYHKPKLTIRGIRHVHRPSKTKGRRYRPQKPGYRLHLRRPLLRRTKKQD